MPLISKMSTSWTSSPPRSLSGLRLASESCPRLCRGRLLTYINASASNGIPEKEYSFDLQLWGEIIPEVRIKILPCFPKVRTDPGRTGNQEGRHFPSYRPCPQEEGGSGGVLAPIDQGEAQQELGQDRFLQGKITDIISSWLKC